MTRAQIPKDSQYKNAHYFPVLLILMSPISNLSSSCW
ncbi:DUF4014 family protein [uncultured Bacteroides sp.]